jgi:hypothetical protein
MLKHCGNNDELSTEGHRDEIKGHNAKTLKGERQDLKRMLNQ